jgi:uncharacterized protein with HEPN domain
MQPESHKLLWDAITAARWILDHVVGHTFQDYRFDEFLRLSTERQFIIHGEALSQLARKDPETADRMRELHEIVGFRNILVHGYSEINDELVWNLISVDLPPLIHTLDDLLKS